MTILLYLWQLPQNLLGLLVILFTRAKKDEWDGIIYYNGQLSGGVSLGKYIIIDRRYYNDSRTIHHEHGHQKQSLYLGWLYLLLIGLPSAVGNLLHLSPRRSKGHKTTEQEARFFLEFLEDSYLFSIQEEDKDVPKEDKRRDNTDSHRASEEA